LKESNVYEDGEDEYVSSITTSIVLST